AGVGTLVSSFPTSAPVASGTTASAGTPASGSTTSGTTTAGNAAGTGSTGTTSNTNTSPSTAAAPATSTVADGTYNGQTVSTRFGTVQVNAVIAGGKITDVVAVKLTDQGRQSVSISNQAAPMIRQEVLSAQSARVSNIGGATYTTRGYLMSLQSALDAAAFTG
ncbi:MAG: hypothetical protein JJE28_07265, partial [Actinomycetales bacterium]|nr:hypothetical protein [Actinomycetales bacterium]